MWRNGENNGIQNKRHREIETEIIKIVKALKDKNKKEKSRKKGL